MVDTKKKQTCIWFRPSYEGFDRKPPLCISFWNLEFAYLPHPFVKYLPSPLKKTLKKKNCFGSSFWIPFYQLCKRIPLDISHDRFLLLWLTAIIQSSLQVFSIFAHVSANSLNFYYPIEKKKKKKKKEGKRVRIIAFTISRSHVSHLKPYFCRGIQSQYLSDPCCLGR